MLGYYFFLALRSLRRTRMQKWSRDLVAENALKPSDLIWPIFVIEGSGKRQPVKTMPVGLTVDALTVAKMIEAKRLFQVYGRSPAMLFMPEARALVELEASIVRKMGDAYCG